MHARVALHLDSSELGIGHASCSLCRIANSMVLGHIGVCTIFFDEQVMFLKLRIYLVSIPHSQSNENSGAAFGLEYQVGSGIRA